MSFLLDIDQIEEYIFKFDIGKVATGMVSIIDNLNQLFEGKPEDPEVERLLETLTNAIQNQDYLLMADLLEYRLKPMVQGLLQ